MVFVNFNNLTKEKLIDFIATMFEKIKFDDYNQDVLCLLTDMINLGLDNTIMQLNLNQTDLNHFVRIYESYVSNFNVNTQIKMKKQIRFRLDNDIAVSSISSEQHVISIDDNPTFKQLVDDKVKEIFNDKLTSLNTTINSQSINSQSVLKGCNFQTSPSLDDNILKFNYQKILMCKHHINIMNLHKDNKSTPASLFFNRFPEPFFGHDIEFIQAYNKRIVEFQTNVMNDIILFSEKKIAIYEEIIEKHISSINDKPFNFNNLKENKFKN